MDEQDNIYATTNEFDNLRASFAREMMPVLYNHIKRDTMVTESRLMSLVCEESVKYADEMMRQLGYKS